MLDRFNATTTHDEYNKVQFRHREIPPLFITMFLIPTPDFQ